MKWFFRIFFKTLRLILGPILLAWERLTTPKGVIRTPQAQAEMDARTAGLALYQFRTCPFCIKVRRNIARHTLRIPLLDAQHDPVHREALQREGGQLKVPCLRIDGANGEVDWLYESDAINKYLDDLAA
jgi:glutaredoxin